MFRLSEQTVAQNVIAHSRCINCLSPHWVYGQDGGILITELSLEYPLTPILSSTGRVNKQDNNGYPLFDKIAKRPVFRDVLSWCISYQSYV